MPQSFSQHHAGPHDTWQHPKGTSARLDFIAIDPCLMHDDVRTWVSEEVDLSLQRIDHLCVMADIPMSYLRYNSTPAIRHHDVKNVESPNLGGVPWQVNVHDHAAMLQHYMQQQQQKTEVQKMRRKHHLRDETWQLVQWKKFHWKRMRQVRRTATNHMLRAIFNAWSAKKQACQDAGWSHLCDITYAWHWHQYEQWTRLSQKQIRQDDKDYYQSLMADATQANADEGLVGLWRNIKGILPKMRKKAASNIRCRGPAIDDIRDHFNSLEAGEPVKYEALLHQCQMRQQQAQDDAPLVIPLSQFPTRIDFEQQVLRQHPKKAPGIDQVQGLTLRKALQDHPVPFYTLLFKTWATGAEPVQFKGGLIHCISKKTSGRAGDAKAKDMRGIMLLDGLGKSYHALIRSHLMRWSSPRRLPTQFGGYKGQQTLFATQFIRSISQVAQEARVSTSMLFLDVRSAFHSMIREQTFGGRLHFAPRLRQLLGEEGFEVDSMMDDINRYSQDFIATAPTSLQRLLQDAHESTWFTIAHHDECYQTHRGPGSPLADLAYNTMMQSVLHEITQVLEDNSDIVAASAQIGLQVGPIAWVDDVAIPIMTSTAQQLDEATTTTLMKVDKIFRAHGLRLNYSNGKTEAVLQYRGTGAPALRKERFVEQLGCLSIPQHGTLRTVSEYQYLGTSFSQAVSLEHEVQARLNKATQAYRMLRRQLFSNRRLPIRTRLLLLDSLVTSILLHGAGNWPLLATRTYNKINHAMMKWYRTITGQGFWKDENVTDAELLAIWEIPSLALRLCKLRLLYAFQWYKHGPQALHDIVTAEDVTDHSWFTAVRQGIVWLRTMCEHEGDAPVTTEDTLQWIHDKASSGARQVRRAITRYLLQQHMIFDVYNGHRRIKATLSSYGAQFTAPYHESHAEGLYKCLHCDKAFDSAQALQGHVWSWHRRCSDERLFVYNDTCQACGVCFWTAQRVQQHLKSTRGDPQGCLAFLMEYFDPLPAPVQVTKPGDLQGFHRLPQSVTYGPHERPLEPTWQRSQARRLDQCDLRWAELGYPTAVDQDTIDDYGVQVSQATQQWHRDGHHDVDVLENAWHEIFASSQDEKVAMLAFLHWGRYRMYEIISMWIDPDDIEAVDNLFQATVEHIPIWNLWCERDAILNQRPPPQGHLQVAPSPPKKAASRIGREPILDHLREQNVLLQPVVDMWSRNRILPQGVPLLRDGQGRCYLVVMHMFAGRRRDKDCCYWAHQLQRQYFADADFEVLMLSVDTAVDPINGNMDNGPVFEAMVHLASSGPRAVALGMSGPPCGTWSAARHLALEETAMWKGPRPLRTRELLWGLTVSQGEGDQADVDGKSLDAQRVTG